MSGGLGLLDQVLGRSVADLPRQFLIERLGIRGANVVGFEDLAEHRRESSFLWVMPKTTGLMQTQLISSVSGGGLYPARRFAHQSFISFDSIASSTRTRSVSASRNN